MSHCTEATEPAVCSRCVFVCACIALLTSSPVQQQLWGKFCSQYGEYDDDDGSEQPSTPRGRMGGGKSRVQFARRSSRGVRQAGESRRKAQASKDKDKGEPQDYMSRAKQLWNVVGKVRLKHLSDLYPEMHTINFRAKNAR